MIRLVSSYIGWHYGRAYRELFSNCKTFLWFLFNFFSIKILLHTLFSPWQRLGEAYKRGLDIEALFSTFILNTLMRLIGFFVRTVVIILGLLTILIATILCIALFIIWTLYPVLGIFFFISGIRLLLM